MHPNSLEAHSTVSLPTRRMELLAAVHRHGPATAPDIQEASGTSAGLWKRAPELEAAGLIARTGSEHSKATGRRAMVLTVTEKGQGVLQELGIN